MCVYTYIYIYIYIYTHAYKHKPVEASAACPRGRTPRSAQRGDGQAECAATFALTARVKLLNGLAPVLTGFSLCGLY